MKRRDVLARSFLTLGVVVDVFNNAEALRIMDRAGWR